MAFPALPPNRRERAGDTTRARLFEAALEEFRRVGFARATVARIAREAGVSAPSFYFHFPTKEHVLFELDHALQLGVAERLKRSRSLREALDALVDELIQAERSVGSPELFRDMLRTATRRFEDAPSDYQTAPALAELGRHFAEGAERGELRPGLDPQRAHLLCFASLYGVWMVVPSDDRRADFEQIFSFYLAE